MKKNPVLIAAIGGLFLAPLAIPTWDAAAAATPADTKKAVQYLDSVNSVRSACDAPAWTLWYSNGYKRWRNKQTPSLTLNYSSRIYSRMAEPPAGLAPETQQKFRETLAKANETLKASQTTFKEMADYINASDFKDDNFKKGDALNEKLEAYGKTCFGLMGELEALYADTAAAIIASGLEASPQSATARTMMADWEAARQLSAEMAKGEKADMSKVGSMVKALSELVDKRKTELAAEMDDKAGAPVKRFYISILNDRITVPMRRLVREISANPKSYKDEMANVPRSTFASIRAEIDINLPGEILSLIAR